MKQKEVESFNNRARELKNIRKRIRRSKAINGRLNRWSFRKLQEIIEYKAKLAGLNVTYVNARGLQACARYVGEG
jgi:putative transposase